MEEKRQRGRIPWFVHLWPGAAGVFRHGRWSFLILALLFGALLDATLFFGYYWTELLSSGERRILWSFVGGAWGLMLWIARILDARLRKLREDPDADETFLTALEHYLKGNWFETECCAHGLLRRNPRDAEAALLLATLYRHTGRYDEAMAMIEKLQRYEESTRWSVEIAREKTKLREALAASGESEDETAETEVASDPDPDTEDLESEPTGPWYRHEERHPAATGPAQPETRQVPPPAS